MNYFVWPVDGLRTVTGNPRLDRELHQALINGRRQELAQLRDDIIAAVGSRLQDREAVRASIGVYPGIGQLLINDELLQIPWLEDFKRRPLKIVLDSPLPKPLRVKFVPKSAPAQPWHLALINKPGALSGNGVRIGVIDTGYDPTLPDLQPPAFLPTFADYVAGSPPKMQLSAAKAHSPHGSIVCAFLAGQISGVAPGATVFVAAVPAQSVLVNQPMLQVALDWLNTVGCDIITTSIFTGVPGQIPLPTMTGTGPSLESVDHALSQTASVMKTLVTAAIGNTGSAGNFQHPGSSPHTTGVGAVNQAAKLFGSAFGSIASGVFKPDIVAPGYQLEMPLTATTSANHGGTSFAAPIVAGAAALVLESDPTLKGNPAAIAAKLATLVRAVPGSPPAHSTGAGLLDLGAL